MKNIARWNGKPRIIKIQYPEQWQTIEQVKTFVGKSQRALIPHQKKFVQQETAYDNQVKQAGIHKAHGLRHAYAQRRYQDLTGWLCPAKGGFLQNELNSSQRQLDKIARQLIAQELGHERPSVVAMYCGK